MLSHPSIEPTVSRLVGYNSRWALGALPHCRLPPDLSLLVVWFGANDAVLPEGRPAQVTLPGFDDDNSVAEQHVPLSEYRENIREIVHRATQQYTEARIVILTPPPVCTEARLAHQRRRYGAGTAPCSRA